MVNALLLVDLYVRDCSKGRGQQKRTWGIEMDEAQETYCPKPFTGIEEHCLGEVYKGRSRP
jgi:hypothetical protein